MQRLASSRRLLQAALAPGRAHSSLTAAAVAAAPENGAGAPKMPPFAYTPPPYDGPRVAQIAQKRAQFLSPSLFHFYDRPLNIVDGKMQYLFDEDGRRYLDAFGGIATVCCGHCHPDVIEAIVNQAKKIQHSTVLYLNHAIADFAEALAAKMPGDLKVVFFTNSGTEANELALMIARLYTGCHDIISLRNGYHGNAAATMGATGQCNWKFNVVQRRFQVRWKKYARDIQETIDYGTTGRVAGFISEAIQVFGGIVELAPGYLPVAYDMVRKAGGLCIADEVQAGVARTGSHFWGFEGHGVIPDIVTMAKGIGNGIPIGAVVTTPEIAKVLTRRSYFNTFGGNPVSTAAGHAVLKVLEKEKLQENAFGKGLLLGVELVTDRQKKTPAKAEIAQVMSHMKDMGVLVGKGGFFGNVFRVTPPLCFSKEDSDFLIEVMDIALSKL
ncbi:hypothetical protein ZWY2020_057925 [Hordeum vulgare]|nr:hypothetical protein ZWY2020_057925 [Hordeum vulgare]